MRRVESWAMVCALLSACGGQSAAGGSDSSSHWLRQCEEDQDCGGSGLSCHCNQCTKECSDDDTCDDLGPSAVCTRAESSCGSPAPSLCLPECDRDGDCADGRCAAGRCVEEPDAESDDDVELDAATPPTAAADAGPPPSGSATASSDEPSPAQGSPADDGGPPELPRDATTPGAPAEPAEPSSAHCAFPAGSRDSSPSGIVSEGIPFEPRPESELTMNGSEPGCGYALSEPLRLVLDDLDAERRIAFTYDVNDDGVDDLFLRDASEYFGQEQVFDLWVSNVENEELTFHHEACDALGAASAGYHYFQTDFDQDGVPDLVVGMQNSFLALRNTPEGFEEVLRHNFLPIDDAASEAWASLLQVTVADVLDDTAPDLVVGFDRNAGLDVEFGVMVFSGQEGETQFDPTPTRFLGGYINLTSAFDDTMYFGEFAVHRQNPTGRGSLLLQRIGPEGWSIEAVRDGLDDSSFEGLAAGDAELHQLWSTTHLGALPAVAVSLSEAEGDMLRIYLDSGLEAGFIEPLFPLGPNRELGGGGFWRDNQFILDADANTSADFVELPPPGVDTQQIAIHLGDLLIHFLPPKVFDLPRAPARTTLPFAAVNGQTLGLLLYDGDTFDDAEPAPMLQHFSCEN